MSKLLKASLLMGLLIGCCDGSTTLRARSTEKQSQLHLPSKTNVWIYVMAGQSNMAGRAAIEAQDRTEDTRILTLTKDNEVALAKEPLHFYEPSSSGLDCGVSFGLEMLNHIPKDVSVLLVPTAVGGSSIVQWINDETHREVRLMGNFRERVGVATKYGTLKGILWHQGEADAHRDETIVSYESNMVTLFDIFREISGDTSLPIVVGHLGSFAQNQENWDRINTAIDAYANSDAFCSTVETSDLDHKGDRIHFDSKGQRCLGKRYATTIIKMTKGIDNE